MSANSTYAQGIPPDIRVTPQQAINPQVQLTNEHSSLDFIDGQRDASAFLRAQRHSGVVRALKIILPVIGVVVVLGFVGVLIFRSTIGPSIDLGSVSLDNGNLVMENPKLNGTDSKQRPYNLSADRATQNASNPKQVRLDAIQAMLPMQDGDFANLTAGTGEYDADAKTLVLKDKVTVKTDSGMEIQLLDANVDMDAGRLSTDNLVTMKSKEASISSQSLEINNNGDLVIFDRKVRITLYPKALRDAEASRAAKK